MCPEIINRADEAVAKRDRRLPAKLIAVHLGGGGPTLSQRRCNSFRIFGGHHQQGTGRSLRRATALLPIPKGGNAHADQQGKFTLRFSETIADRLDIGRSEFENARSFPFAPPNLTSLLDALDQFIEILLSHLNSQARYSSSARNSSTSLVKTGVSTNRIIDHTPMAYGAQHHVFILRTAFPSPSYQYPIRRLGFVGGSISARMASNTTLNCRSTFPSISSSRRKTSLWEAANSRSRANARMMAILT